MLSAAAVAVAGCSSVQSPALSVTPSAAATTVPAPSATPTASGTNAFPTQTAAIRLETVVQGLVAPVGLVPVPGSTALLVIDQRGVVHVLQDATLAAAPFIDLTGEVVQLDATYDERGLLGVAFHPDFAANGRVFLYYGARSKAASPALTDHADRLVEVHADPVDPLRADASSARTVLEFDQPQPNHSGGGLGFGPDGYLYLSVGDGGGAGDASEGHSAQGNAQDLQKLNGKVLRIDVDGKQPYAIPPDNPFAKGGGRPEIYAYGFRNPWRLSWEPAGERRLLVSDVGYGRYEEIDVVTKGGNYGWRIREGRHCLDVAHPLLETTNCPPTGASGEPLIDPVVEYTHRDVGVAIVGGYVYRGAAIPALAGKYVFGDWSKEWTSPAPRPRGSLLVATPGATDAQWEWDRLVAQGGVLTFFVTGIGEDGAGELYVLARTEQGPTGTTGQVLRIAPTGG